jgi:hypothetical protein
MDLNLGSPHTSPKIVSYSHVILLNCYVMILALLQESRPQIAVTEFCASDFMSPECFSVENSGPSSDVDPAKSSPPLKCVPCVVFATFVKTTQAKPGIEIKNIPRLSAQAPL